MKIKILGYIILSAFLFSSCYSLSNPFGDKKLYQTPYGYINRQGEKIITEGKLSTVKNFSEGLAAVQIVNESNYADKWGYIDETGKFVIKPQFEKAERFSEGFAAVKVGDKFGYIDKTGKFIINPQFDDEWQADNVFSDGLAPFFINKKAGYIDKTGKIIINAQFDYASSFREGLAAVELSGKWGFIDKAGKYIINPQFEQVSPFSNGLAVVIINRKFGYTDKTGKIVINPQFDYALPFSDDGIAKIQLGDKVGFINKEGKYTINPQFTPQYTRTFEKFVTDFNDFDMGYHNLGKISFSEGLSVIKIGDRFGYIDNTGKIVINPQFKFGNQFNNGMARVVFDSGDWAYIDKEGKVVWRE